MDRTDTHPEYKFVASLSIPFVLLFVFFEVRAFWSTSPNWGKLLSPSGTAAISIYLLLFIGGLYYVYRNVWSSTANALFEFEKRPLLRWLFVPVLLLIYIWIYLYSPWQDSLPGPWTQLTFSMAFAQIIFLIAVPHRDQKFGRGELALTIILFLYPRIVYEFRQLTPLPAVYRSVTAGGFFLLMSLALLLYWPIGGKAYSLMVTLRKRLYRIRWLVTAILWCTPLIYRYIVGAETYILYPNLRFFLVVVALCFTAFLTSPVSSRLFSNESIFLNFGVLIFVSALTQFLLQVVDYPFSLTWSEGNRLYDYSLIFGQQLYNYAGNIINPYNSPGRYVLWGILFLWKGLPIWVHRLWNIVLLTVPPLLFGYLITRKLKPISLRYGMLLWITLFFVVVAPLHPPFVLVSILVVLFAFDSSIIKRGLLLVIAGYYASLSRWTWIFAPAAIGALIDLILYYPARQGKWIRRIVPIILLVFFSILPGLLQSIGQYFSFFGGESLTSNQPLLWYRLLPNSTLGPGVLFLALYTTGPLIILLSWWILSHRWKLDWVQGFAIAAALIAFFAVGLIISTKIGGGGDLHNLDMYLITLIVVFTLGLTVQLQQNQTDAVWRPWVVAPVALLIFIPIYGFTPLNPGASYSPWLDLPKSPEIETVLSTIRTEVDRASQKGEVLFMDQRQLLTFKYIDPIPFVPEYEKKYMMDQAMGNNARYFEGYYRDLANRRFALIVTEPLRTVLKSETGGPFSEENDAWVKWISDPTLCYYEQIYTSKKTNVELLIPRQNPIGCEKYLQQAGAN